MAVRRECLDQLVQSAGPVFNRVRQQADTRPCLGKVGCPGMRHGTKKSFDEEVVDIDPNIMMVERKIGRARSLQPIAIVTFFDCRRLAACLAVQEYGPALLEKSEERFPVGTRTEWPFFEGLLRRRS